MVRSAVLLLVLSIFAVTAAGAQTFTVIHNFTNGGDGANPSGSIAIDRAGNLYGTSSGGRNNGTGVVFKLSHAGSGWIFTPLHTFSLGEGNGPLGVSLGPDGNLYGATEQAGGGGSCGGSGCGTVFKVSPPATRCASVLCPWVATVLYRFSGGATGGNPQSGVVLDRSGNIYGVAPYGYTGGNCLQYEGCGLVYEVSRSGGQWIETVLYQFTGEGDGLIPYGPLAIDSSGNLYGPTKFGGAGNSGTVYKLTPSGSGWTKSILYSFGGCCETGIFPTAGVILDSSGNLYGTTLHGGNSNCSEGCGSVFSLTSTDGTWAYNELYDFTGANGDAYPQTPLVRDAAGNLYGTTFGGVGSNGNVFKVAPSNGGWTYTSLHDFTGGADGSLPYGNVVIDANGNLYGTAEFGGTGCVSSGCGVVWEITP